MIFSFLFGDANVQIRLQNSQKAQGEFIGTYMNHVHILVGDKIIYYACDDIISITYADGGFSYGKGYDYDCSKNTVTADILFPPQLDPMTGEMTQMLPEVFIQVELWGVYYSIEYTTEINLSNSGLTGEIPSEIGNLTNLTNLTLYNNQLTGSIPSEIGNLTNLTYLDLGWNQLTGEIPESICDLTLNFTDYHFNITNNQLCPPYPSCIEDYVGEQDTSDCP